MSGKRMCFDCNQIIQEGTLYARMVDSWMYQNCNPEMRSGCKACSDGKSLLNWSYERDFICDKCYKIKMNNGIYGICFYSEPILEKEMLDIYGEGRFIWCCARKEMGLLFYLKARDKLIKKLDEIYRHVDRHEELKKKKMLKRIGVGKL